MPRKNIEGMPLEVDSLFTTQKQRDEVTMERVIKIALDKLVDFPHHPFKVLDDDKQKELAESIKEQGVLVPAIVRVKDGNYEMISGHRRKKAVSINGGVELDCIVRNLTDEQAIIVMVDSNLQREKIFPSEKAFAYKMKMNAINRQGTRTDLTSSPMATKSLNSALQIGKDFGDGKDNVYRYIRLTELNSDILQMVDEEKIAFRPAVEISYLTKEEQCDLYETMLTEESTPSLLQASKMKELSKAGRLNIDVIFAIITEKKPNQQEKIVIKKDKLKQYFPDATPKEIEDSIIEILDKHFRRERMRNNRER